MALESTRGSLTKEKEHRQCFATGGGCSTAPLLNRDPRGGAGHNCRPGSLENDIRIIGVKRAIACTVPAGHLRYRGGIKRGRLTSRRRRTVARKAVPALASTRQDGINEADRVQANQVGGKCVAPARGALISSLRGPDGPD